VTAKEQLEQLVAAFGEEQASRALALLEPLSRVPEPRPRRRKRPAAPAPSRIIRASTDDAPDDEWIGMYESGRGDLAERHEEILRSDVAGG
jgi:hypothetical protein